MERNSSPFLQGYKNFTDMASGAYGAQHGDSYIHSIASACEDLERTINSVDGYETGVGQLKGDIQEFRAAGTFNIRAVINDSNYRASVDRSHDYASPDITTNWGKEYGLKALFSGKASAKAQSISQFQRFKEYTQVSGRKDLSFDNFLAERGLDPKEVLATDPIYSGQARLIPSDQLEEAIQLRFK